MSTTDGTTLELYKLMVEMADRVSARRTTANSFFLTIHSAALTAIGLFGGETPGMPSTFYLVLACLAGVVLSAAWWMLLKSYRDLNSAKFKVINEMERSLPAQPYTDEWKLVKKDDIPWWRGRYAELGTVERFVPIVIAVLYVMVLARLVLIA